MRFFLLQKTLCNIYAFRFIPKLMLKNIFLSPYIKTAEMKNITANSYIDAEIFMGCVGQWLLEIDLI